MAKNEVVETKAAAVVTASDDWGDYAGVGREDISSKDLIIPILGILQSNSPDVQASQTTGDGSIRMGMFKNSVTGEYFDGKKGLVIQPVYYEKIWIEWQPRSEGGRLLGFHLPESDTIAEVIKNNNGESTPQRGPDGKKRPMTLPGSTSEFVETHQQYVMLLDDTGSEHRGFAVINFKSTGITVIKKFQTTLAMMAGNPPCFAVRSKLSTKLETNPDGSWALPVFSPINGSQDYASVLLRRSVPEQEKLLKAAFDFRKMIVEGMAKVSGYEEERAGAGGGLEEQTPF